jgi:NAD(P)-dependent dehydrogenase (short-subunit alcohol dehydrogenase family)
VTKQASAHSLVVGGTRGIGRALVELLISEKHVVSVIARRIPGVPLQGDVRYWAADLQELEGISKVLNEIVSHHGKLKNLVFFQRFKGEGDKWEGELATSVTATKSIVEACIDRFHEGTDKSIVMVSSIAASLVADEQDVAYHVAKAAINQMSRYYAVTLGPKGFRVNVVSPGTVLKAENSDFYARQAELQKFFQKTIPLGRMGTAAEVAKAIMFLCSPDASFITGQNLFVDGGVNLISTETLARRLTNQIP